MQRMIRVLVFLVIVGALALGVAWLADRPGEVVVTWLGWRIDTSVMVLAFAIAAVAMAAVMLWSLVRAMLRSPDCSRSICAPAAACAATTRSRAG